MLKGCHHLVEEGEEGREGERKREREGGREDRRLWKADAKGEKLKCKRDDVRGKAEAASLFFPLLPSPSPVRPHFFSRLTVIDWPRRAYKERDFGRKLKLKGIQARTEGCLRALSPERKCGRSVISPRDKFRAVSPRLFFHPPSPIADFPSNRYIISFRGKKFERDIFARISPHGRWHRSVGGKEVMGTGDLFSPLWEHSHSIRATCHPFRAPNTAAYDPSSPCFPVFRRAPFDSLSLFLPSFLSLRSTRLRCHSLRCTPFRPNTLDDRRRSNVVEPLLDWTVQNGRRLGIYFFRGASRDIFLPSCICSFHLFPFLSSWFIALRRRCVSREILGRREYETTTGRHCAGDRRTDNRNDSPAHLYLNDSHRVFPGRGGRDRWKLGGGRIFKQTHE